MNVIATSVTKTALTETLESQLGDPKNPGNPLSFAYSQKIDETEQFPEEAIRWLYDRQLARHYVPEELGGSFRSFCRIGGGDTRAVAPRRIKRRGVLHVVLVVFGLDWRHARTKAVAGQDTFWSGRGRCALPIRKRSTVPIWRPAIP